jgi:hypothetical protein
LLPVSFSFPLVFPRVLVAAVFGRCPSASPRVLVTAVFGRSPRCLRRGHLWPPNENSSHQFPPKNTIYPCKNTFFPPKRVQPII